MLFAFQLRVPVEKIGSTINFLALFIYHREHQCKIVLNINKEAEGMCSNMKF